MNKATIPMARLKSCVDKNDVTIVYDIDGKYFVAKKGSIEYGQYTVSFELAQKSSELKFSERERSGNGKAETVARMANND